MLSLCVSRLQLPTARLTPPRRSGILPSGVAASECLEGQRRQGTDDAWNVGDVVVDEFADILPILDVDLQHQVVIAAGRIKLRYQFRLIDRVGNLVGLAGRTLE